MEAERLLLYFSTTQMRRPLVIWQLLKGKLTTSTLYWAMRYRLLSYYKQPFVISKETYQAAITKLLIQGDLKKIGDQFLLTPQGQETYQLFCQNHYILKKPELFGRLNIDKWSQRMLLAIQVTSELSYQNQNYLVSIDDFQTQYIIKKWIQRHNKKQISHLMHQSLTEFLQKEDKKSAWIFCQQLVGHDFLGKTLQQLALEEGLTSLDIQVIWWDLASRYALFLKEKYPIFMPLLVDIFSETFLPKSVLQTKKLLLQGLSVPQIATKRHLKLSTIKEHILNLAILEPNFDIAPFFLTEHFLLLSKIFQGKIDEWEYNQAQESIPTLTFFEFRLFLIERSRAEFKNEKS